MNLTLHLKKILITMTVLSIPLGLLAQQNKQSLEKQSKAELIKILKSSPSLEKRVYAAIDLEEYKDEEVVDALCEVLLKEVQEKEPSFSLLKSILKTLGNIGNRKAFLPILKSSQYSVSGEILDEMNQAMEKLKWQDK